MNEKIVRLNGLTVSYANSCLPLAVSSSHYDLLCLSLVLYYLWNGSEIEKSIPRGIDYRLNLNDDSLCSRYGSLLKSGKSLDELYETLNDIGLWDANVTWPYLK
jgi:hypothetical protein